MKKRNPVVRQMIANPKRNAGQHGGKHERHEQVFRDRMECEVRALGDRALRVQEHGSGEEAVHDKLPDTETNQGVPAKDWIVVLYRNMDETHDVFVRKRHQWEAHANQYIPERKWKVIAECDTNIEAVEWARRYAKLLKE